MKKIVLISAVLGASLMAGCSTVNKSAVSSPVDSSVRANLAADVTVGEKITGEVSQTTVLWFIKLGSPKKFADGVNYGSSGSLFNSSGSLKAAAAYKAIEASNADVIVAPKYIVETSGIGLVNTTKVTVEGYKGTLGNIRTAK